MNDEKEYCESNYRKRIDKMERILNMWKQRNLSLKEKIIVENKLVLSALFHVGSIIHTPEEYTKEIKTTIFIWSGKTPKIKYNILIQPTNEAGLKLMDTESKLKALKLNWVRRLCSNLGQWKLGASIAYNSDNFLEF